MVFTSTATPSLRLHVQDLPEAIDILSPGGVYALVVDTPPARFPLLTASLSGALDQGLLTSLLLATPPQPWLERLEQLGMSATEDAVQTGRLQVFQQQTDFTKKIFRHGTPAFVQELEHFGLPRDSLLVVDQADDLLSLHDMGLASGQAEVLSHWARAQGITMLLVFTRVAAVPGAAACLNGLMDSLRGIARLGGHNDGLNLRFEYWQSPSGTVAAKDFALSIQDNGWYKVQPSVPEATLSNGASLERLQTEGLSHDFYYLDHQLDTLSQMVPGQWSKSESVMAILREAMGSPTPTVLLCFKPGQSLRNLAESVHALRLSLGRRARLVVVERDMSLRYANEVLLLRLGANLILHRDMTEARMLLMLESLQGQIFSRDLAIDFEQALLSVTTPSRMGYAHPSSFCSEVLQVVERLNQLNVPSSLVVAPLVSPDQVLALLKTVQVFRQGDLFTTDGVNCYFFFCGCPSDQLSQVWAKVMPPATREGFQEPGVLSNNASILQQTRQLALSVQGYHFPIDLPEHLGPSPQALANRDLPHTPAKPEPQYEPQTEPQVIHMAPYTEMPQAELQSAGPRHEAVIENPSYTALISSPHGTPLSHLHAAQDEPHAVNQPITPAWLGAQPTPRFDEPNTAALLQKMLQALPTNQPPH
jgi:cellulose biosynthesis protein BcsE